MANNIKGITIEIGGNTTGLDKALKGTNEKSRKLQNELREVNRQLKFDPQNTMLLNQKQQLLTESVANTKEKLEALKEAQAQVQQQFENGDIGAEQYRAFQRELSKTENQLENLEDGAKKVEKEISQSFRFSAENVSQFGGKLEAVGKSLLPISGAVTAIGAASVKSMDAVDEGLDTIATKTGATGQAADELRVVYENVASKIPAAFGDIGAAIGEINTRLDFTGEKLETASEDFLQFAKVNGVDVNTSVQLVTRAMGDAGIAADDYAELLDMLTVAGQKSGISIDALTTNLAKYGAPMRALGIDTRHAIAMFAAWEKAGVNTEIAFSGMKKAISNWGKAGKDATVEFQRTLDTIGAAPDIATATSLAIEAFGAKAGPDLADAIQGGRFAFDDYIAALEEAGGTVDTTYGLIVDEVDDSALASQRLQMALHDLGETIMKTIGPILLMFAEKLQSLMSHFNEMNAGTQRIIVVLGGIAAAIGPLLILVGTVISKVTVLAPLFSSVTGAISAAGGAFALLTGPIGIAIGIIAALALAVATNFGGIRDTITQVMSSIATLISSILGAIRLAWESDFLGMKTIVTAVFDIIAVYINTTLEVINGILDFFSALFQGNWSGCWEAVRAITLAVWDGITQSLSIALHALINLIINIGPYLLNTAYGAFSFVLQGAVSAWELLKSWLAMAVNDPIGMILSIGAKLFEAGKEIFGKLLAGLQEKWKEVGAWIEQKASEIANKLTFWRSAKEEMGGSQKGKAIVDGSHAMGLDYVPFNGYIAELHQGERVLTAEENEKYQNRETPVQSGGDTFVFNSPKAITASEAAKQMKRAKREIVLGF